MPKKKKSKNLVLPILGISLFTMLGITVYVNRPTPTPLRIAEVSTPETNCASIAFTDNFSRSTLDTNKWFTYEYFSNGTATIDNGTLKLSVPSGKTGYAQMFAITEDKVTLEGDFVQEITLNSLTSTPSDQLSSFVMGVAAAKPDSSKFWYRAEVYSNGDIQTYNTTNEVTTPGTAAVKAFKNTPTKLKMARRGSTLTTYYDTGSGYVLHSSIGNAYTGKLFVQLILLSHPTTNPAAVAVVDDYKLGCLPPTPTNLTHTCSSDGSKILLKWDDVSPSHKYHFALNDPSNDNSSGWFISNSTDVWRGGDYNNNTYELPIIPNHKYDWWVQSNSNGPSSDTSNIAKKSFSCEPKPDAPLSPRITCNPDGKSVRLMWYGVTDVESYKVRLDDKAGHVTNYDNLKDAQYIAAITPDKTYSFWVHSHKGNYDSNQSTSIDFTCKVTSTPTPTPTPKPTVKPISKGDEISVPTDTPKPSVKTTMTPKSSPTSPSYVAPSPVSTYPEATEKPVSKNPISRFFTWLAGLFE